MKNIKYVIFKTYRVQNVRFKDAMLMSVSYNNFLNLVIRNDLERNIKQVNQTKKITIKR